MILRYRLRMCPLYDIVAHRYHTISCMTGTDRIHRNTEAYMHTRAVTAFDEQCRSATIIRSFDRVNGWPVGDWILLSWLTPYPIRNNTNNQLTHASALPLPSWCQQWHNQSINQSINVKFVGRRYTTRPGAPTVVSGKHDQKVHSWVVFWTYQCL